MSSATRIYAPGDSQEGLKRTPYSVAFELTTSNSVVCLIPQYVGLVDRDFYVNFSLLNGPTVFKKRSYSERKTKRKCELMIKDEESFACNINPFMYVRHLSFGK